MIKVSYNNKIILNAIDSDGGHALAAILTCSTIPESKKKINAKGELEIDNSSLVPLNDLIKHNRIKVNLTDSFHAFIKQVQEEKAANSGDTVKIDVYCINSKITGKNVPQDAISKACRYFLVAARNTPSFKNKKWDGYIKLYDKRSKTFPTGLLSEVIKILEKKKIKYVVNYMYDRYPEKQFDWRVIDGIVPDPDQIEAVEVAVKHGRGIVKAPTGWGKTAVFAKNLISKLGVPALFIANKKQLLDDAKDDFTNGLAGVECLTIKDGMFGRVKMNSCYGESDLQEALSAPIIVATIQSLSARIEDNKTSPILLNWLQNVCKLVIVDESQAVGTATWDSVLNRVYAPYRIFLSATPRRTDGASIKLVAGSGPCIFSTTAEEQIAKGRLCELDILYDVFDHKMYNEMDEGVSYSDAYKICITHNEKRNQDMIVKPAIEMVNEGRHVLILIQHIEHGHLIKEMLIKNGVSPDDIRFVWGDTPQKMRTSAISEFRKGEFKIMIGSTIFDAGVNIPVISGVVLGGAGNSDITLIQRIGRGARNCEYEDVLGYLPEFMKENHGKKITKVVDVMDANVKFFSKQSRNRYKNACDEFGKDRVHIHGDMPAPQKKSKNAKLASDLDAAAAQFNMMMNFKDL